jgi:tRNA A-37 threonylcarbamoyl transferase component Bud32
MGHKRDIQWHLAPAWPVGLGAPDLERWRESMAPVKLTPHRDVFRVRFGGHDFHLKHYRPDGREWLRSWFRPPKACAEFEIGRELLKRGVGTLEPLAWGQAGLDCYLITRTLPDAVPLIDWLDGKHGIPHLARALGEFLAHCHAVGVRHDDLHPGNLLLREGDKGPELYLIDLAMASVGAPLSWSASRDNLLALDRWFAMRFSRTDRLRAWKAYHASRGLDVEKHHTARALANETAQSLARIAREMDGACLGKGRHFHKVGGPGWNGLAVAEILPDEVTQLVQRADEIIAAARVLKHSASSTVVETVWGSREVVLKRVEVTRWTDPIAALFRAAPPLHAWMMGHALCLRGVPTPRPLAVWHRHLWGLPGTGYLLMEKVPAPQDLLSHVRAVAGDWGRLRELAFSVGRLLRQLHGWELSHRDLKAANVLVSPAGTQMGTRRLVSAPPDGRDHVWLCDLAGVSQQPGITPQRRARDLARLNVSFLSEPVVSRTLQMRVLRAYMNEALGGWANWKHWWRQIVTDSEAKLESNRRSGRVLG